MKGKKKKLIPNSTIKREIQNLTPFRSKESLNAEHEEVKRKLFTEENRNFGYCVAIVLYHF